MASAGDDADRAWRTGRALATDLVGRAPQPRGWPGIYVMPQFGRYDRAADVVEAIRSA